MLMALTKYTQYTTYFIHLFEIKVIPPTFFVFSKAIIHNLVGWIDSRHVLSTEIPMSCPQPKSCTQIKIGKDLWEHTVPPSVESRALR